MILKALKFTRFQGEINEWSIEGKPVEGELSQWLTLENINLIVGKNASGKSRTIDAIRQIADLVSGEAKLSIYNKLGYGTATYHLKFSNKNKDIIYHIKFKAGKITQETLTIDGEELLNREKGKLYYEEVRKNLDFQTDSDILAVSKRDKKQHSFFEDLYTWGKNLNHYRFGHQLGKDSFLRDMNVIKDDSEIDLKDGDEVAGIFIKGKEKFSDIFVNTIMKDMEKLSYKLKKIDTASIKFFPIAAFGINVQELDIEDITDQSEMSQGMFRALSLLIQLNFSLLNKTSSCILIDDIGEGLDYERSKALIDLMIEKVKYSNIQLVMSTNDRFVMNKIPLEYWSVIQRVPKKSLFYNYRNSKDVFDDFTYTGLNNFDFLSTNFYITGFETAQPHN